MTSKKWISMKTKSCRDVVAMKITSLIKDKKRGMWKLKGRVLQQVCPQSKTFHMET